MKISVSMAFDSSNNEAYEQFGIDAENRENDCEGLPPPIAAFYKKEIFRHLNKNGCSEQSLNDVMKRFKIPKSTIIGCLNSHLNRSELYLYQECASFCFENINEWMNLLIANNWADPCEPLVEHVKGISKTEQFPSASEFDGIDMRAAYEFLSNGLQGLPQPMLNKETADMINNEMKILIEEINSDDGDQAVYAMYENLLKPKLPQEQSDLDPMSLDTGINR